MDATRLDPVLFFDGSKFCVYLTDRRARDCRRRNERLEPVCIAEHGRYGGGPVMVCAGISFQGKQTCKLLKIARLQLQEAFMLS